MRTLVSRRTLAVLGLVVLLALAGCSGGGGGDGDVTTTTAPETTTQDDAGGDGDDGGDGGDGSGDGDDGSSDGGDGDDGGTTTTTTTTVSTTTTESGGDEGTGANLDSFANNLQSAESYTLNYTIDVDSAGEASGTITGGVLVNREVNASYERWSFNSDEQQGTFVAESYVPPGASVEYTRLNFGEDIPAQYQRQQVSPSVFDPFGNPLGDEGSADVDTGFTGLEGAEGFRDEGMVSTDEGPRRMYVIDSLDQLPDDTFSESDLDVRSVYFEVLVDEEREIVTDYVYELTYDDPQQGQVTTAFELRYSAIDSTSVPEPGWFEEARDRTDGSNSS